MKRITLLLMLGLTTLLWTCGPGSGDGKGTIWTEEEVRQQGMEVTKAVGSTLIKTVQEKMTQGGAEAAIAYCRVSALPITDSLAQQYGVRIKRTAQRTRNPENSPDELERRMLTQMAAQMNPEARVQTTDAGDAVFFQPILLQPFCETCHGKVGEGLTIQTDSIIKTHYPEDRATGFAAGELRGMWAVYF